jgi:hypothetical protein
VTLQSFWSPAKECWGIASAAGEGSETAAGADPEQGEVVADAAAQDQAPAEAQDEKAQEGDDAVNGDAKEGGADAAAKENGDGEDENGLKEEEEEVQQNLEGGGSGDGCDGEERGCLQQYLTLCLQQYLTMLSFGRLCWLGEIQFIVKRSWKISSYMIANTIYVANTFLLLLFPECWIL